MFQTLLGIAVVLIAALLIVAALQPNTFRIQRAAEI